MQEFLVSSGCNRRKYCFPPITHPKLVYKGHALILNLWSTPSVVTEYVIRENKLFLTVGVIATQIQRQHIIEPFRLEVTSGSLQSNILHKAGSTLNAAQVAQGFV